MSNSYCQFCERIEFENVDRLISFLAIVQAIVNEEKDVNSGRVRSGDRARFEEIHAQTPFDYDAFDEIEFKWDDPNSRTVLVQCRENCDLDKFLKNLQRVLKVIEYSQPIIIQYSFSSNRFVPGGFGGGAAVLNCDFLEVFNPFSLAQDLVNQNKE